MQLSDQFGSRTVELIKPRVFCNAVNKNGEGIQDPTAHLTCYQTGARVFKDPRVISTDQFGSLQLSLRKQRTGLCIPSQEVGQPSALNLDHFDLYRATRTPRAPTFARRDVNLADQFLQGTVTVTLKRPVRFGVPTNKNDEGISDVDSHLTCYSLRPPRFERRNIDVQDQFGQLRLTVTRPTMLCVPSVKQVVSGAP